MTEPRDRTGRIDLGSLAPDAVESERMIGAVIAGVTSRPQLRPAAGNDVLELVGRSLSPAWIAAAAMVAIAGSAAVIATAGARPEAASVDALVATWADRQHVPTNAELLLAFQGYRR